MTIDKDASARICLLAKVTNIPGDPLRRARTIGEEFCNQVLRRPFNHEVDFDHIPPKFDSSDSVSAWFVYDINVACRLSSDQMDQIPHYVFLASFQQDGMYVVS